MKPTKEFLKAIINEFYQLPGNICGGNMHVVLDDGNFEKHHIEYCLEYAKESNDTDAVFVANMLLLYSTEELKELFDA